MFVNKALRNWLWGTFADVGLNVESIDTFTTNSVADFQLNMKKTFANSFKSSVIMVGSGSDQNPSIELRRG